jgi:uncharacterized protein
MIRVTNLKLSLDQALNYDLEITNLQEIIKKQYRINNITAISIYKKAVDARRKNDIHFVYTVDFLIDNEKKIINKKLPNLSLTPDLKYQEVQAGTKLLRYRPVIIGFGPSGIFAAHLLAKRGYQPVVFEMGLDVDNRDLAYESFIKTRVFDKQASIQFGEGGAGTYSDGKLTTSISDLRIRYVLELLVKHGADKEILYLNRPHVGTDKLKYIIKSIRNEIIALGGEICFNSEMTDIVFENNTLKQIEINHNKLVNTEIVVLGIGHSSRDTFEMLNKKSVRLSQKPFSMGLRVEHPQKLINLSQYGSVWKHPSLRPADYKLSYHDQENNRTVYSFCMCPGGYVVCGTSEVNGVVTNGMSENKRDGKNANSALLVNVTPKDFGSDHVLAGMYMQRKYERLAFEVGGLNYNVPAQLVGDFLENKLSQDFLEVKPTYKPGVSFVNFNDLLPKFISDTLRKALIEFDRKIKGFAMPEAILTGFETRSSSPVRIERNERCETSISGLFAMGEGSGYAGGIMSSAVDGLKTAEAIINTYSAVKKN